MKSRMEKYSNEDVNFLQKRTSKNSELYKEISNSDLDEFNITSNARVIGENSDSVNVEKIKEILEKNYHDVPKRSSVKLAPTFEEEEIELEETREYDINAILEKAREEKEVDYEKERLKKVRDTQYDILKNLNLEENNNSKAADKKTKEELLNLINTITENELQKTNLDPLDILTDLKGDENTVVMGAKEKTQKIPIIEEEKKIDNSFYTNSLAFDKKDFDDFEDLEDNNVTKIITKVLLVSVVIAVIIGIIVFLNSFLKLGLF